jgi:hypothetical protein
LRFLSCALIIGEETFEVAASVAKRKYYIDQHSFTCFRSMNSFYLSIVYMYSIVNIYPRGHETQRATVVSESVIVFTWIQDSESRLEVPTETICFA